MRQADHPHPNPLPPAGEGVAQSDGQSSLSRERERARVRARSLRGHSTMAERALWHQLRDRRLAGHKFRRQHPIGPFFADFVCIEKKLIVELDGGQHFDDRGLLDDASRTATLNAFGFHVVRYDNRAVLTNMDGVLQSLLGSLCAGHPHPNPLPPAGEGANSSPKEIS